MLEIQEKEFEKVRHLTLLIESEIQHTVWQKPEN